MKIRHIVKKVFGGASKTVGWIFSVIGIIGIIIVGIWGLIIDLAIINEAVGFWGVVIGFTFFPILFAVAPWYALIAHGNYFPLLLQYGGGIAVLILFYIGHFLLKPEFEEV